MRDIYHQKRGNRNTLLESFTLWLVFLIVAVVIPSRICEQISESVEMLKHKHHTKLGVVAKLKT